MLDDLSEGTSTQHKSVVEAYQTWKKADASLHGILVM